MFCISSEKVVYLWPKKQPLFRLNGCQGQMHSVSCFMCSRLSVLAPSVSLKPGRKVRILALGFSDSSCKRVTRGVCVFSHTWVLLSCCYSHRQVMAQILKLQCMYSTNYSWRKTLVLNTSLDAYKNPSFAPVKQATSSLPCNIIKLRFREVMVYSFPCCLSAPPQAPASSYQVRAAAQCHASATPLSNNAWL